MKELKGRATELISLYVPEGKVPDAASLLRDELGKCGNIKSRVTRQAVESGIKSAQERLKLLPTGSFAIFVGNTSSGWISEAVEAEKPLKSIIYRCGSSFFLDPLEAMRDKGAKYAIVCMDLSDVTIAILQGTSISIVYQDDAFIPGKIGAGGQSAPRYERNRQLAIVAWYKKVSEAMTATLLSENLTGIIISGSGLTKNEFNDSGYVHHELRKKIIGIIDTGYTGEQGIRETIQNSEELLKESELVKQRTIMREFLRQLSRDGKATYGQNSVLKSLNENRIKVLLLTIHDDNLKTECEKHGTEYKVISDEFEEGAQLKNVFGGYAALLRY